MYILPKLDKPSNPDLLLYIKKAIVGPSFIRDTLMTLLLSLFVSIQIYLEDFIHYVANLHPSILFTYTISQTKIPFLVITLHLANAYRPSCSIKRHIHTVISLHHEVQILRSTTTKELNSVLSTSTPSPSLLGRCKFQHEDARPSG